MPEFGVLGYSGAALLFFIVTALLLTSWRGRLQGGLLLLATSGSGLWAAVLAYQAGYGTLPESWVWVAESCHLFAWLAFLVKLLMPAEGQRSGYARALRLVRLAVFLVCLLLIVPFDEHWLVLGLLSSLPVDVRPLGQVLLAVVGVMLVEQLFRNTPTEQRWGIKYLCLGLGGMFVFDFYLFSDALLFKRVDANLWDARGAVNTLIVPLIAVSVARNPQWSLSVYVSRRMVFHTTAVAGAGIYLLLMSLAGYYIKLYGGDWGAVLEVTFLFAAGLLLLSFLFSGKLRAGLKVFLSKHFFDYRYDYRDEWLRLINLFTGHQNSEMPLYERIISALAGIVESTGGFLWLRNGNGDYDSVARWNLPELQWEGERALESLAGFLQQRQWVVNLREYEQNPELYGELRLPDWLLKNDKLWLVVPLIHDNDLFGFVVLAQPRIRHSLNWENLDLLKMAGCQAASYLALNEAAVALAEARQFEGFNRLSAFVVHDLKNLIAQLSLVARNAVRHKHNPDFIDDAVHTIENSVNKMNRLMGQLRGAMWGESGNRVELGALLRRVVEERGCQKPAPVLEWDGDEAGVQAEPDRIGAVIGHIIQNAQDATPPDGTVRVVLRSEAERAIVEVVDTGCGMDEVFIRERLFRPFDSTKGLTGMGIGAYECREFVQSSGGRVEVKSRPGEGTSFLIALPLAPVSQDGES